jgi:hypothetical protein
MPAPGTEGEAMGGKRSGARARRQPLGWDIILTLLTSLTLMFYGVLCLYGMFYYKINSPAPGWSVAAYQRMMNGLATPLTILLILWLVLCIPKRLFSRRLLFGYSAAIVTAAAVAYAVGGIVPALALALFLSALLQTLILILVLTGARLRFSRHGLAVRVGSSLIHLGFVLFIIDLVLWRGAAWHIPVFWVCTVFMTGGCLLTFYFPRLR